MLHINIKQYKCIFQVRPASRENVAAHAEVLRGGEERQGPGGGARQEGAAVQTAGKSAVRLSLSQSPVIMLIFTDKEDSLERYR